VILGFAAFILSAPVCAEAIEDFTVAAHGMVRHYLVVAPARSGPVPVILVLHGAGGSAAQALGHYHWDTKGPAAGFLTIGVEASPADPSRPEDSLRNPRVWNDGSGRGALRRRGTDDVGYVRAVLDEVGRRYAIDQSRVFATGFSSGASMTWRLGVDLADQLAAIAPVAGMWAEPGQAARLPSVLYITGTEDPLNPMGGGTVHSPWGGTFAKPPAGDNPARWARALGCTHSMERRLAPGVMEHAWPSCAHGTEVLYVTVERLGHHWPGGVSTAMPARLVGLPNNAVDATTLIIEFFERHRLAASP
jgi:polyhydroxybutyrate depolymerase